MTRIAPSLLAADFSRLADEIADVEAAGADLLHLDLMDGHFVPNLSFGPLLVRPLGAVTSLPLDAHLMVTDPDPLIAPLADAGVARLAVHVEAAVHLHRTLAAIADTGMAPGVALNPATPVSALEEVLDMLDFVVLMSVDPGFGGQSYIPSSTAKLKRLRRALGPETDITVDGGVGPDNAGEVAAAGASTLVAGSSVFGAADRRAAVAALRQAAGEAS